MWSYAVEIIILALLIKFYLEVPPCVMYLRCSNFANLEALSWTDEWQLLWMLYSLISPIKWEYQEIVISCTWHINCHIARIYVYNGFSSLAFKSSHCTVAGEGIIFPVVGCRLGGLCYCLWVLLPVWLIQAGLHAVLCWIAVRAPPLRRNAHATISLCIV